MDIKAGTAFSIKLPVINLSGTLKLTGNVYAIIAKAASDAVWSTTNGGEWTTRALATLPAATLVTSGERWYYDAATAVTNGLADMTQLFVTLVDNTTPGSVAALSPTVGVTVRTDVPAIAGSAMTLVADQAVNVSKWNGTAVATPATAGYPAVTIKSGTGTGEVSLASGVAQADVAKWLGTACATPDTAGYPKVTHKVGTGTGELQIASGVVRAADGSGNAVATAANQGTPAALAGGAATLAGMLASIAGASFAAGDDAHAIKAATGAVTVDGYASGKSPADLVLSTATNKLVTDSSGRVVATNGDGKVCASSEELGTAVDTITGEGTATLDSIEGQIDDLPTAQDVASIPANVWTYNGGRYLDNIVGIYQSTAVDAFSFPMRDSSDHISLKSGLTVAATRSIDGGSFGACDNAVSEIGTSGVYKINLSEYDVGGAVIVLKFTADGADTLVLTIITQRIPPA